MIGPVHFILTRALAFPLFFITFQITSDTDPTQLGLPALPESAPEPDTLLTPAPTTGDAAESSEDPEPTQTLRDLHTLLLETSMASGKLACGNCGHEYAVKEGIANFLLPSHMV